MKKKIKYKNERIGKIEVVRDFLPRPEELALKENNVKVTLNLSKSSIDFFKEVAKKNGSQYQKVIRNLLDLHVEETAGVIFIWINTQANDTGFPNVVETPKLGVSTALSGVLKEIIQKIKFRFKKKIK